MRISCTKHVSTLLGKCNVLAAKAGVRPEVLMAAEVNEIFSGYQWCHLINSGNNSGTVSIPIIRFRCDIGSILYRLSKTMGWYINRMDWIKCHVWSWWWVQRGPWNLSHFNRHQWLAKKIFINLKKVVHWEVTVL